MAPSVSSHWFRRLVALWAGCTAMIQCQAWIPATTLASTKGETARNKFCTPITRNYPLHFVVELSSSRWRTTKLGATPLPNGYQEFGERLIRNVGSQCGISNIEDLSIEWKADRIIVTVPGQVYVSAAEDDDEDTDEFLEDVDEDEEDFDEDEGGHEDENSNPEFSTMPSEKKTTPTAAMASTAGVDLTALARAINEALNDGGVGFAIAENHAIDVTTPGAPEELQGRVMFEAYKGFDVICQQEDSKTKKIKQIEGKLVERNLEFTILNVKGRAKKMKNSTVLSVKLPKAKKEKGVK